MPQLEPKPVNRGKDLFRPGYLERISTDPVDQVMSP